LGGIGVIAELYNPGNIYPGVTGVILLILAWVSLGNLPVNWAGAVLIAFAIALGTLEVYVAGFGVLGVGAIISFCIGGLLLFFHTGTGSPMSQLSVSVSLWVLIPVVSTVGLIGGILSWFAYKSRDGEHDTPVVPTTGEIATVATDLNPKGTVHARNELWTAISDEEGDLISSGVRVKVVKVDGIVLTVSRL
jgi:membrane-bound serine protease (ClpP class)